MPWSDTAADNQGTPLTVTATYALSGLTPHGYARVFVDGILLESAPRAADGDGKLELSATTLDPTATIRVDLVPAGTLIIAR